MRKVLTLMGLLALAMLFVSQGPAMSQVYEEGELAAWQAVAETYYTDEGLANENLYFESAARVESGELDERWAYSSPDLVKEGMIAPDFTLLDMEGVPHSLSDFRGEKFVFLINGSWY